MTDLLINLLDFQQSCVKKNCKHDAQVSIDVYLVSKYCQSVHFRILSLLLDMPWAILVLLLSLLGITWQYLVHVMFPLPLYHLFLVFTVSAPYLGHFMSFLCYLMLLLLYWQCSSPHSISINPPACLGNQTARSCRKGLNAIIT